MLRRAFLLMTTIGLIQFLITACCPNPVTFYSRITGLKLENYNLQKVLADSTCIPPLGYRIKLTIEEEALAKAIQRVGPFLAAYATSCLAWSKLTGARLR